MATFTFTEDPLSYCAASPRDEESDGQLLDRFIDDQDAHAFEELVRRHGRMVLGVCRRVLDNAHDAEDCFQAVFLVLVRKAASVRPREMVGNWLYGVAYRTALEARKMAARRRNREQKRCAMHSQGAETRSDDWQDLQPLLDQELAKLPDKYRGVLVSCDLEGKTRKEVAHALGLPEGTVASRLARARVLLAKRLSRRNLSISVAALASLLSRKASADVPHVLAAVTARAASQLAAGQPIAGLVSARVAALTDAALTSLLWSKLAIASAVMLVLTVLGIGIGALLPSALAQRSPDPHKPDLLAPKPAKPEEAKDCVIQHIDTACQRIQASGEELYDLQVSPTTKVFQDGAQKAVGDLQIGMIVHLQMQRGPDGRREALHIEIAGEAVIGMVASLNEDSVTIRSESEQNPVEKTYHLDKEATKFIVNSKKAKYGDLKLKMRVIMHVAPGRKTVGIKAAGPKVAAIVRSVQIDKRTLALNVQNTHLVAEGVAVAADADIMIDGKKSTLADLKAGMQVTLQMSAESERSFVIGVTTRTQESGTTSQGSKIR